MKTKLGKFLKVLRTHKDENLTIMGRKLGISTSYLSSIENGKREIPKDLFEKIVDKYELSPGKQVELEKAIGESLTQSVIELKKLDEERRELTLKYARRIQGLSKSDLAKMREILDKED